MTTAAPLGTVRIERVNVTRQHSAVVLLVDESAELREWLWGTSGIYRGKAMGRRLVMKLDGITVDAGKLFAKPAQTCPWVYLTLTTASADTRAAALGRRVGQVAHEVTLTRQTAARGQGELKAKAAGPKRVTVEVASADARG